MAERFGHKRDGDTDATVVGHLRATDTVITGAQRWATVIVMLICFGINIGVMYAKFGSMSDAIADLRTELKSTSGSVNVLSLQTDRNVQSLIQKDKEIADLREQIRELRAAEPPEVKQLRETIADLKSDIATIRAQTNAFSFNFTTRLAEAKAKAEANQPKQPEQPKE